ncbi:sigma-70 family RNA polymerase sigma factor [Amycolatopsis australiensis]|uniref:RNA polymerase sigma factor, sigma-70 family n=1 Tax=Amycolatopsis australiensis TaxID=546364 RepID=A0A1K1SEI9_9PSEU|nr:sigma-70 family RNA polymerase sigma factor [Amycolatopsis australiensis]SFW82341.1 RNA polymerase sigma factor, sigma-70 family [Amycolatopsis australiensis]
MADDSRTPLPENAEWMWRDLVARYSSLIRSVCRQFRISGADAEDVSGAVWLRLVANLPDIREPDALPGWLRTTTRHECLRLLRHRARQIPADSALFAEPADPAFDATLLGAERRAAARHACARLPRRDRELLALLFCDPPKSYREISATLGMPIGSIGPSRARCLARVRRMPAIAALLADDDRDSAGHVVQSARATA